MEDKHHSLKKFPTKRHGKNTTSGTQKQRAFAAFKERPKTMLQVAVETGILRANLCRRIAEWREEDRVKVIYHGLCPISKCRAGFYSTNPKLF